MSLKPDILTRSGKRFPYSTIGEALVKFKEVKLPQEVNDFARKVRGGCIDDGTKIKNPNLRFVPISGAGAGEDPAKLREILAGVGKIKPHEDCGKAALVLAEKFRHWGKEQTPTQDQIDWFAAHSAKFTAALLGIECGRTIDFNDGRKTRLERPRHHHLASAAVIALSDDFPHNFKLDDELPPAYRLGGHFLGKPHLRDVAASEAMLALKIASGDHGVGIVPGGFTFTALLDEQDPATNAKLVGLNEVWQRLGESVTASAAAVPLNQINLEVISYSLKEDAPDSSRVEFDIIRR